MNETLALALLLGIAPPPAVPVPATTSAGERGLEEELIADWKKELQEHASTRLHAKFMHERKVPIKVSDDLGGSLTSAFYAAYEADGVHVSRLALMEMASQLRRQGVPEKDVASVLAAKTFPLIVHELRHGLDDDALKAGHGIRFESGYVENELSAYADEILVLKGLEKKNLLLWWDEAYALPQVDANYKELRESWDSSGLDGLRRYIDRQYKVPSILSSDREYLARTYKGWEDMMAKSLGQVRARERALEAVADPEERARNADTLRRLKITVGNFERDLARLGNSLDVLEDPRKYAELRDYYVRRLESVAPSARQPAQEAVAREGYEKTAAALRELYSPVFQKTGDVLWIEASWDDTDWTVEAKLWPEWWRNGPFLGNRHVRVPGGFARRLAGLDAVALAFCHELGHHLGGAPQDLSEDPVWRSAEGQADYWAASECLKEVFSKHDNVGIVAHLDVPRAAAQRCDAAFPSPDESAICKRSAAAAQDLVRVFPAGAPLDFSTPDSSVAGSVVLDYPSAQCRLDTFLAGALRAARPRCWFR